MVAYLGYTLRMRTLFHGWPMTRIREEEERQITWKWYNIQLYLQWLTNRKSYMIYRTAPFSMNGPYPQFQGHDILWRWIPRKRYEIQIVSIILFNGILIGTYSTVSFRPWVTLSELTKYSMTRSVARSLCDSWASCISYLTWNNIVTLKSGLDVTQDHSNSYHSKLGCGFLFAFHSN